VSVVVWREIVRGHTQVVICVVREPGLARVYTENWRRHADHSTPNRAMTPWWVPIRAVWGSLTRRRPKRWNRDMGEHG
jgi:hypothetical protein